MRHVVNSDRSSNCTWPLKLVVYAIRVFLSPVRLDMHIVGR